VRGCQPGNLAGIRGPMLGSMTNKSETKQFGCKGLRAPLSKGASGMVGRAAAGVIPAIDDTKPPPVRWFMLSLAGTSSGPGQLDFKIGSDTVEVQHHGITEGVFERETLLTWLFDAEMPLHAGNVTFSVARGRRGSRNRQVGVTLPELDRYRLSSTELIELQVRLLVWGEEPIGTYFYGTFFG
jgi:hypothetical protein